jgi:N-acetylmuramoyl-L-alanine amidase
MAYFLKVQTYNIFLTEISTLRNYIFLKIYCKNMLAQSKPQIMKSYLYIVILIFISNVSAQTKFKVVLDAGHGGKDYGASYHGYHEKDIALDVVKKIGRILEKNPNIDLVYTRSSDVFVELDERADIANREKATIFISIHCNANKSQVANGFETYVMGVARNKSNLEVAKLENDVVSLEKYYKQNYEGYNPNSPESAIGMLMLQEEYRENSVELAARIQRNFAQNSNRKDRGVREAGFLVLRKIAMPRILVEMGFISHQGEGEYLASEDGQHDIAIDVASAILSYKKEFFGAEKNEPNIDKPKFKTQLRIIEPPKVIVKDTLLKTSEIKQSIDNGTSIPIFTNTGIVFKVQLTAISTNLSLIPSNFKGLENVSVEESGNLFKYYFGDTSDYNLSKKYLAEAKSTGYKTAFLVAYKNGKKIDVKQAAKLSIN